MTEKRPRMAMPLAVGRLLGPALVHSPMERCLAEARIWEVWAQVVGQQIAAQAKPSAMRDGILTVLVASAPWMQQLNFLKGEIRDRLNDHLGAHLIRDIHLKAGKPPRTHEELPPAPLPDRPLTAPELAEIAVTVAGITDTDLREACQRLLTTHHRRH